MKTVVAETTTGSNVIAIVHDSVTVFWLKM